MYISLRWPPKCFEAESLSVNVLIGLVVLIGILLQSRSRSVPTQSLLRQVALSHRKDFEKVAVAEHLGALTETNLALLLDLNLPGESLLDVFYSIALFPEPFDFDVD